MIYDIDKWTGREKLSQNSRMHRNRATIIYPSRGPASTRDVCPHLGGHPGECLKLY
jgi:hypothetical protein